MRTNSYAKLAVAALTLTGYMATLGGQSVAQTSPVKVSIETNNSEDIFNAGEPIALVITVKNTGVVEAELSRSCDTDNEVSLTDARGNPPPLTVLGKKVTSEFSNPCPRRALRLQPGESKQIRLDISQIYDLSRPGKYTISISRFVRKPRGTATSSPLTFVVRQKVVKTK